MKTGIFAATMTVLIALTSTISALPALGSEVTHRGNPTPATLPINGKVLCATSSRSPTQADVQSAAKYLRGLGGSCGTDGGIKEIVNQNDVRIYADGAGGNADCSHVADRLTALINACTAYAAGDTRVGGSIIINREGTFIYTS